MTPEEIRRAQARLAVVEHLLVNIGSLYETVATGAIADPEVLAVFTDTIAEEKAGVLALLDGLTAAGAAKPIDKVAATNGRMRVEQAKGVLGYLMRTLPALLAPLHTDEDGNTVAALTAGQETALGADVDRAVAKLRDAVTSA